MHWDDATIAWVSLYHRIGKIGLEKRNEMQEALKAIKVFTGLSLFYFRWESKKEKFI